MEKKYRRTIEENNMSWMSILKRDPLKDNGKKILDYCMQAHTYMKNVDELFELVKHPAQKSAAAEAKNTKERVDVIAKSITEMETNPQGIASFYINDVIPQIKKEFESLRAVNESLISAGFLEYNLTPHFPKPIDFDKMKRELEFFVDEGDLT